MESVRVLKGMVKKILVAIDGSEPADKALDYALDLAESLGAEILILSVVPHLHLPISSDPEEGITASELFEITEKMRSAQEEVLKNALMKAQSKKPRLKISTKLVEGHPADEIIKSSEEGGFDLIVMGSRGLHGFSEFLLGSTTHRVADHCKKPLLIIK
jgi:nucleotide-binding universal stress UspA family protein